MTEEPDNFGEQVADDQEAEGTKTSYHSREAISEHIADRTGELLGHAIEVARQNLRVSVGSLSDPRDGTTAHFEINANGLKLIVPEAFDPYRDVPVRRTGTSGHERIESFIDVVNRFKGPASVIYATEAVKPALRAVFDYHPEGGDSDRADWCQHAAAYNFPLSPEWQAWSNSDGKKMSMTDFAHFLEDHVVDVLADPGELSEEAKRFVSSTGGNFASPSKLIELSRGLQINENAVVKETRNLSSGEAEVTFVSEHVGADGKPLKLPNLFVIAIPVFKRSAVAYRIVARLRHRKTPDGLTFWYDLWRPDLVVTDAFEEALAVVSEATGLPIFVGAPE